MATWILLRWPQVSRSLGGLWECVSPCLWEGASDSMEGIHCWRLEMVISATEEMPFFLLRKPTQTPPQKMSINIQV